jgi:drug/metabolite transporter (DMT)-like permease
MSRERLVASVEALLAVIFWGGSFIATKIALRDVSPVTAVWLRFAMGWVILGITVFLRGQFALPKRRDVRYLALLGFLGITFHQWLQSTGLLTSQASTTAWIVATTPVFMAILAWLILREPLSGSQILGIVLAAFGVILVVSGGDWGALTVGQFGAPGDALILLSAPNWALFSILSRRGLEKYPASQMMFYVMGFGLMFTTGLLTAGPGLSEVRDLTMPGWMGIGFLGVFCSGLAYIFWYDALQTMTGSQAGSFLYLEPLVTVMVAAVLIDEPILLASIFGGVVILIGVWLVNRKRSRRRSS